MERQRGIIGPLILITLGILLLLANLGVLPFTFWEIAARFWPLILILIGVEIIVGRQSAMSAIIILVLWIALVVGAIWLSYTGGGLPGAGARITDQLSQPLGDIRSATVDLHIGISRTSVASLGSDSADLMQGTFIHDAGSQVVKTFNVVGNDGRLALKEEGSSAIFFGGGDSRLDIGLNPQIPIALRVNSGVGRVALDLSGLYITSLTVYGGVGSLDIAAPKTGISTLRVNGGVGSITITIPQGVAARIRVSSGLSGVRVDDSRFPKFGDVYQSADFASAVNRIDLEVDGGVGSINIR